MAKRGIIGILVVGLILVGIGVGGMLFAFSGNTMSPFGFNSGNTVLSLNATEVRNLVLPPATAVKIDKYANTIEFYGSNVVIPVVASPENGSMYSFGVYGLVNPTIIVRKDAQVRVQLINADDDMYHGIVITNGAPPYFYMGTMMFDRPAFSGSYIPPLAEEKEGKFPSSSMTFTTSISGTFYYICQVMGHASKGMYGKFIVLS